MLVRRDSFLAAGGFDPRYFAYLEDVDLGWRLWAGGERIVACPRGRRPPPVERHQRSARAATTAASCSSATPCSPRYKNLETSSGAKLDAGDPADLPVAPRGDAGRGEPGGGGAPAARSVHRQDRRHATRRAPPARRSVLAEKLRRHGPARVRAPRAAGRIARRCAAVLAGGRIRARASAGALPAARHESLPRRARRRRGGARAARAARRRRSDRELFERFPL